MSNVTGKYDARLKVWFGVVLLVMAILLLRAAFFQFFRNEQYSEHLYSDQEYYISYKQKVIPIRGDIFDKNRHVLATTGYEFDVGFTVDWMPNDEESYTNLMVDVGTILGINPTELSNQVNEYIESFRVKYGYSPKHIPIVKRVPMETKLRLDELEQDSVQLDPLQRRVYPDTELMCHVLGFVDNDGMGLSGIERTYQQELGGTAYNQTHYRVPNPFESDESRPSRDVVLTIDRSVQYVVEQHLKEAVEEYGAEGGSIVAMNPKTGAMIAMASTNCYDPANYLEIAQEIDPTVPQVANALEYNQLTNPFTSVTYEPGSTFKLLTYASALDANVIGSYDSFNDPGMLQIGEHQVYNANKVYYGALSMTDTLVHSLNTAPASFAHRMGKERFHEYLTNFGVGEVTGIDLSAEESGVFFDVNNANWSIESNATVSYGQAFSITPMQLMKSVGAIANKGRMMEPYLVDELYADGELMSKTEPTSFRSPIRPESAEAVTEMAIASAAHHDVEVAGYTIAGKTGTAQVPIDGKYEKERTIQSFIGWLPANDPELLMLVKLDAPTKADWGSESAAPAFTKLANEMVVLLGIEPDERLAQR